MCQKIQQRENGFYVMKTVLCVLGAVAHREETEAKKQAS